jgi:hypothetical protein
MLPKLENQNAEIVARRQAQRHLDLIIQGVVTLDDAIVELADRDAMLGIAALIARRLQLSALVIARVLSAEADEPPTVFCRAAGLRTHAFSAVLRMRRRRRPQAGLNPAGTLSAYQQLPQDFSFRLLPFLRVKASDTTGQ